MTPNQKEIKHLLFQLIAGNPTWRLKPASGRKLTIFKKRVSEKGVPPFAIKQLVEFYEVADNFEYDIVFHFLGCADEDIFDGWNKKQLWLSTNGFYTIR
jgi:hypothetical protein